MHLQGADSSHDNHRIRMNTGKAALDIQELLSTQVCTEASLGYHHISKLQGKLGSHDGVAAVGDIGKRAAMDQGRSALQSLHQIWLDGILKEQCQGTGHVQLISPDSTAITGISHHNLPQALLHILKV